MASQSSDLPKSSPQLGAKSIIEHQNSVIQASRLQLNTFGYMHMFFSLIQVLLSEDFRSAGAEDVYPKNECFSLQTEKNKNKRDTSTRFPSCVDEPLQKHLIKSHNRYVTKQDVSRVVFFYFSFMLVDLACSRQSFESSGRF